MGAVGSWPIEAVSSLRKLWLTHTASQTASILTRAGFPCSRNAVIGKASRIGLPGKPRSTGNRIEWTETAEELIRSEWGKSSMADLVALVRDRTGLSASDGALHAKAMRMGLVSLKEAQRGSRYFRIGRIGNRNKQPTPPKAIIERPTPPEARMVPLMDLEAKDCRFPIGDPRKAGFGYCGAPKWGRSQSYCEFHHRLCWKPPEKRDRSQATPPSPVFSVNNGGFRGRSTTYADVACG